MTAQVGIDAIRFYTPAFSLDHVQLGVQRGIDPEKYSKGLGQIQMSIMPPDEDIVTMAAHAALPLIEKEDKQTIRMLLFATESGVDQSKAAGLWVHHLLSLHPSCRVVELKQACYSATCALQLAIAYLQLHQDEKILLIASDNARYGLETPGEPTQGCAAVAMLLSANPRLFVIEPHAGVFADHVMDFFRPNYLKEAVVDGKFSTKAYLQILMNCWQAYTEASSRSFTDHDRFCYHIPFTRMAEKAHERLSKSSDVVFSSKYINSSLLYSQRVGNAYAASLYLGLTSLLENDQENLEHKRIGCFSYGSGCVGEFFSGVVQKGYQNFVNQATHKNLLDARKSLSYDEYSSFFNYELPEDGGDHVTPVISTSTFRLHGIKNHERLYTHSC